MKIHENLGKSMKIYENRRKSRQLSFSACDCNWRCHFRCCRSCRWPSWRFRWKLQICTLVGDHWGPCRDKKRTILHCVVFLIWPALVCRVLLRPPPTPHFKVEVYRVSHFCFHKNGSFFIPPRALVNLRTTLKWGDKGGARVWRMPFCISGIIQLYEAGDGSFFIPTRNR